MPASTVVMVSSTARDMPEHRREVLDACLRLSMSPLLVENISAGDADAVSASLALVDEADCYLGIFAYRYGYVPEGSNVSTTEMEYDRAVERKIPRLVFLMDRSHPISIDDVEAGAGAAKLKTFKARLERERFVNYFKSPADLRAKVIEALSSMREPDLTMFHYVSDIPEPPEPFIAHPYTLLQTHRLVGRQPELNLLTDWVAKRQEQAYYAPVMSVVAIGGMGKSALTWKWFNDIAPQEMTPLAGRMWWSFYESDATFENFVTRALAYVSRRPLEEVQPLTAPDRETQLLAALDREPFLLVLDGLERILIAYARMDAARLSDAQVGTQQNLRKTTDPRAGRFLRKLAQVRSSRILISTRLYPADLEAEGGEPTPGSFRLDIEGLTDEDAVELWRTLNVTGSRDLLLPVFDTFGRHPLLIQALAGEVERYRRDPGNFEEWCKANPHFDPSQFSLLQDTMGHVLEFALSGLDDKARQVLRTIAAFRMPASYDTLAALLIGEGKPSADERQLDEVLTVLEGRGLLGWDKRANRYDLHPIVRGVVWGELRDRDRQRVYQTMNAHFEALPSVGWQDVNSIEDLTPAIELYNTLVGLKRYDDAELVFYDRISEPIFYRLGASRQQADLLEMLFPDGVDRPPRVSRPDMQAFALNALALAYDTSGSPARALPLYRRQLVLQEQVGNMKAVGIVRCNLANALEQSGMIHASEVSARLSLLISREQGDRNAEAISAYTLGLVLLVRGLEHESGAALERALRIRSLERDIQSEGVINSHLAQRRLWLGDYPGAVMLSRRAWELAQAQGNQRAFIRAERLQGAAALLSGDFATADERLHTALTRARVVNLIEEELPALVALAELRRGRGDLRATRELLEDVWEAAERGPYPLFHADACNVLAQVERDAGNEAAAAEAAARAYRLAWCDGPPFAYRWGLESARKQLWQLGASEPQLPAFDESKFDPMPKVEIDPPDEFNADENTGLTYGDEFHAGKEALR